ncbi:MAG: radical SAM protein [archaeon]
MIDYNETHILKHFVWESTRQCNLNCKHCGSNSGKKLCNELTTSEVKEMLEDVASLGALFFSITGGEPLARKDIFEIIKHADSLGLNTTLITNGSLVTGEIAKKLSSCGLKAVSISIDGTKECHDLNRGESFEKAINALKLFRENGIITCTSMMVCNSNSETVEITHQMCVENEFDRLNLYLPQNSGRAKENNVKLDLDNVVDLIEYSNENKDSKTKIFLDDGFGPYNDHFECTAGRSHLCVAADGEIKPCISFPYSVRNIRKTKISAVWNSNLFDSFRKFDYAKLGEPCKKCEAVEWCGGGCRARAILNYGSFYAGNRECKEIAEKKPSLFSKIVTFTAIGALGATVALAGCITPDKEAPASLEIKKVNFEIDREYLGCKGTFYPVLTIETDKELNLKEMSLLANGYPIEANLQGSKMSKDIITEKYTYDLNFSTKGITDEFFVRDKNSNLSFDYHGDDILSSSTGFEQLSFEGALPIKENYPLNIYLHSNFELNKEDVKAKMNDKELEIIRLAKLKDDLYLLTASGENIELKKENELSIIKGEHLLSKKFSTAFADNFYYIENSFVSVCPVIVMPQPSIESVNIINNDTMVINPSNILPKDLNQATIMEKIGNEYKEIDNKIRWEKIDGYGYIIYLEKELNKGEYGVNPEKMRDLYWAAIIDFQTEGGIKYIHLLENKPEKYASPFEEIR